MIHLSALAESKRTITDLANLGLLVKQLLCRLCRTVVLLLCRRLCEEFGAGAPLVSGLNSSIDSSLVVRHAPLEV